MLNWLEGLDWYWAVAVLGAIAFMIWYFVSE